MLTLRALGAGYGGGQVLDGVDAEVRDGELVALLGRNGSGRSTLLRAVMGLLPSRGEIVWNGQSLQGLPTFEIARRGVGYVPEQRDIFPSLTVRQNLELGRPGGIVRRPATIELDEVWSRFPSLRERRDTPAGVLSGGEQQMLALCRTLLGGPSLVLVDEPTEGLAPQWVAAVATLLQDLRRRGVAVLLAEQKLAIALQVADRCLVLGGGRVVFDGRPCELLEAHALRREWLEV